MSDQEPMDPMDAQETMMASIRASMDVMMQTVRDAARPAFAARVREVLERNEGIVDQRAEAIDHLVNEIVESIFDADDGLGLDLDFGPE